MTIKNYLTAGFDIYDYESIPSTNATAKQIPLDDRKHKQVVLTWNQTAGSGQGTNRWESQPHSNICLTAIFRPKHLNATHQFDISIAIALACRDVVSKYVDNCQVKWPNDIYVGNQKIAGILIENVIMGSNIICSMCGIGLNVNQTEFMSDAPNPVSLAQLTYKQYDLALILQQLLTAIDNRYRTRNELKKEYLDVLYRKNGIYEWEDSKGKFQASIDGIDEYGRLILNDIAKQKRVYSFKEVTFL